MKVSSATLVTPTTAKFDLTNMQVRHVTLIDRDRYVVYMLAVDVCNALQLKRIDYYEACKYVETGERNIIAINENGNPSSYLAFTPKGARQITVLCDNDNVADQFIAWTEGIEPNYIHAYSNGKKTRWGRQPIINAIKEGGYTAKSFTEEANALNMPNVSKFNHGNLISWIYGHCLPRDFLVKRACELLHAQPGDLFTSEVLVAYAAREQVLGSVLKESIVELKVEVGVKWPKM